MAWPTAIDYFDAVQHPLRRFCRPDLKRSQAALDERGKPVVRSGPSLDIYELRGACGQDRWAIGCYTREPRGLARRYMLINDYLAEHPVPSLVHVDYCEQGICIRGRWFPITHGRWIDGMPLNAYVQEYLDHPEELRALADVWVRLAQELSSAGIAHGNLGPDTVLVSPVPGGSLCLRVVDYDTIYVPTLGQAPPTVFGHIDFQHPRRDWKTDYNTAADRFSQLVVLTSLVALAVEGGALWERFNTGGNLLFRQCDFQEPATSALLSELWQSESSTVRTLAGQLILACDRATSEVPALEHVAQCLRRGAARHVLSESQIADINALMEVSGAASDAGQASKFGGWPNMEIADDLVLELEDGEAKSPVAVAVAEEQAMRAGTPRRQAQEPPPLPPEAHVHPLTETYEFDAWMPEDIAVVKVRGFVKDAGGELVRSIPGYLRVNLLDNRETSEPSLMAWLGLKQEPPPPPRIVAVMELNMVNKPTPQRKLIGITMRLTPGPDDEASHDWKKFCDRAYCELRGYMMGFT